MKRIFFLVILSIIFSSCSNNDEVEKIANEYAKSYICSLFEDAEVCENPYIQSNAKKVYFIKEPIEFVETAQLLEKHNLEYYHYTSSKEEHDYTAIIHRLNTSTIEALKNRNGEGVYIASVNIRFEKDKGFSSHKSFKIILSKDMKVLNKPIETDDLK